LPFFCYWNAVFKGINFLTDQASRLFSHVLQPAPCCATIILFLNYWRKRAIREKKVLIKRLQTVSFSSKQYIVNSRYIYIISMLVAAAKNLPLFLVFFYLYTVYIHIPSFRIRTAPRPMVMKSTRKGIYMFYHTMYMQFSA
jgi:hypothetical protein